MKLSNINSTKKPEDDEVHKVTVSEEKVVESKDDVEDDLDEDIGPIPGISPNDPGYESMRRRLLKIRKRNVALFNKMMSWD